MSDRRGLAGVNRGRSFPPPPRLSGRGFSFPKLLQEIPCAGTFFPLLLPAHAPGGFLISCEFSSPARFLPRRRIQLNLLPPLPGESKKPFPSRFTPLPFGRRLVALSNLPPRMELSVLCRPIGKSSLSFSPLFVVWLCPTSQPCAHCRLPSFGCACLLPFID